MGTIYIYILMEYKREEKKSVIHTLREEKCDTQLIQRLLGN